MYRYTKSMIIANLILVLYSLSGVCGKKAATYPFLSRVFIFLYCVMILLLLIYAACWQQIIKRLPLTLAYTNKAVTIIWGLVWGVLLFNETITLGKIFGALIVASGIVLFIVSDETGKNG